MSTVSRILDRWTSQQLNDFVVITLGVIVLFWWGLH